MKTFKFFINDKINPNTRTILFCVMIFVYLAEDADNLLQQDESAIYENNITVEC